MPKRTIRKAAKAAQPAARRAAPAVRTATRKPTRKAVAQPMPSGDGVRVARVARGKKPQYFADPAVDKLLWITMTLVGELSVARDRIDAVERLLEQRRVLRVADVDAYQPDPAAEAARERRRQAYLDRVLRAVQAELEEITGRGMPRSNEEVIAAVSS
jgi:hypothetical protein